MHWKNAWMNSSLQPGCRKRLSMTQNPHAIKKIDYQKINLHISKIKRQTDGL